MTFRTKLLLLFVITVVVAVVLVGAIVSAATRRAFERLDAQRVAALVAQFRQEYARRQRDIARQVQDIADADSTLALALPTILLSWSWSRARAALSPPLNGPRAFCTRRIGSCAGTIGIRASRSPSVRISLRRRPWR